MNYLPPIPGPPVLLDFLSGLLFLVHLLFMNFVVAAPLIIAGYLCLDRVRGRQAVLWLSAAFPVAFTFAINFGIPPLLFSQTIYTEQFYTANILLGTKWLAVILWLLISFYGSYLLKHLITKNRLDARLIGIISILVSIFILAVGATMIGNYFVSTTQSQWPRLLANPYLILQNPTFLPRVLHFLCGSFAIAGFWMTGIAWWRSRNEEVSEELLRFKKHGLRIATFATGVEIIVGIWFVLRLPTEILDSLFSGSAVSLIWMTSIAASLVLLGFLIVAALFPNRLLWQKVNIALLIFTLIGMIISRNFIRITLFGPSFDLEKLPNAPFNESATWFFILLPVGLAVIAYLIWLIWISPERKPEELSDK